MLKTIEKVLLLQDLEMFHFASTEHVAHLANISQQSRFGPGETIFRKSIKTDQLYLLVRGEAEIQLGDQTLGVKSKTALNLWSFLARTETEITAVAVDSCLVLTAPWDDVNDILISEPDFSSALLQYLAQLGLSEERHLDLSAEKSTLPAFRSK